MSTQKPKTNLRQSYENQVDVKNPYLNLEKPKSFSTLTTYYLKDNGKRFDTLDSILSEVVGHQDPVVIFCRHGNIPHQDTEKILSGYKADLIVGYTNQKEGFSLSLNKLLKGINTQQIHAFKIYNVKRRSKYSHLTDVQKIIKIAHNRTVAKNILRYSSAQAILDLYNKIPYVLNNTTLKGQARKCISVFFKKKFNVPISKRFVFRLPSIKGLSKKRVRHTVISYIQGMKIPRFLKRYIQSRTYIVFTKNKSLVDIMSNNIHFGKNWRKSKKYVCECKFLNRKYLLPLNEKGHVQINSKDIKKGPFKRLFNLNCRNKCKPDLEKFKSNFNKEMMSYTNDIKNLLKSRKNIKGIGFKHTCALRNQIEDIYNNIISCDNQNKHSYPSQKQIESMQKKVYEKLVISECGKGKGILHFCCPVLWSKFTQKNLYDDEIHFKKEKSLTPEMVLEKFREKYEKEGWDKIAKLNTNPDIPYICT